MNQYKALAKWMPTGMALAAIPVALALGLFFAAFRFVFYLGWIRWTVDRTYLYVITPLFAYAFGEEP
jgi:hypothetical protein